MTKNKPTQKRYQYRSSEGIVWTKWFDIEPNIPQEPYQLDKKLKNEYR